MKATEMVEKWEPMLRKSIKEGYTEMQKVMASCILESVNEAVGTIEKRRAKFDSAVKSIFIEHNTKFNKFSKLMAQKFGTTIYPQDMLLAALLKKFERHMSVEESWFPLVYLRKRFEEDVTLKEMYDALAFGKVEGAK